MTAGLGLEGRCALVTSGTSEFGRACVLRLCDEGMTVAFTSSSDDDGEGAALLSDSGASLIEADRRDRASNDRAVASALELGGGRLDALVTTAPLLRAGSIEATSEADLRELLEVNLTSAFRVARTSFAAMRARRAGSMIHVASDAGIRAVHQAAAYSVASAGVINVAELFGAEGAPHGVRSNAVCPDDVDPDAAPSGRVHMAAEVAAVVAWLACDQSAHVNGATLRIDGARGAAMVADTRG